MKKKRPRRSAKSPAKIPRGSAERALQYKVIELSTVDEGSIERAVNQAVSLGWTLENVQFAMRESSKRPAMAFVFFTREASAASLDEPAAADLARDRLRRLSEKDSEPTPVRRVAAVSAFERLRELSEGADEEDSG